eukprot:3242961-Pleurochrysis_carterae.AAC.1
MEGPTWVPTRRTALSARARVCAVCAARAWPRRAVHFGAASRSYCAAVGDPSNLYLLTSSHSYL